MGKVIDLDVVPENTIGEIKTMIETKIGLPSKNIRLIYNREILGDDLVLSQRNIMNGCTIELYLRLKE
jgi:hypothetical protein